MSWLRQGSQNSLEKSKLKEDQQEFQEEVLDFMGLGFCMPREAWRLPPPNLSSSVVVLSSSSEKSARTRNRVLKTADGN